MLAAGLPAGSMLQARDGRAALTFTAVMEGRHVAPAPAPVETTATARATAVLVGHRLTVHGSFSGLASPLRDLIKTPNDPGVHLHRGAPGETSPYFHGLQVTLNADERSGIFYGAATLTDDQLKALLAGTLYVDIHTVKFGPGEVRGQWRPLDPEATARRLLAIEPVASRADVPVGGACHASVDR